MDLVGVAEAAEILGWDKRRVSVYQSRGLLPTPVAVLRSGPVWRREDIEAFARGQACAPAQRGIRMLPVPMSRETEALLEAGVRVWSAVDVASRAGIADDDSRRAEDPRGPRAEELQQEYLRLALTLAAEQAILRLLGWKEEAWPPWAEAALNGALAALAEATGERYRIRGWRLERRGDHGRWRTVQWR